jgi:CheY-like chemotaxis protein
VATQDTIDFRQQRQVLTDTRILVVEAGDQERKQVEECLRAWRCSSQQVKTSEDALRAIVDSDSEVKPFGLILFDCRLSGSDDFVEFYKLATQSSIPMVGLGASESSDLASRLNQIGIRHLLSDPIRPSALFEVIATELSVHPIAEAEATSVSALQRPVRLSGQILVAEDNRINQIFVTELLKHYGCACDIANNGHEVLIMLQKKRYDLILMDCQMPEMDGFSATREIRRLEAAQPNSHPIPIVALTANALKGDRERCLASGMDGYLSKPLETDALRSLLQSFLKPASS